MTVTKKHFEAIAEIMKTRLDNITDIAMQYGIEMVSDDLANYFEKQNPQFDRIRFLKACGVKG